MDWCPKLILCKLIKGRELALKQITSVYWTCKSNPGSIWILLLMESMGKNSDFSLLAPLLLEIEKIKCLLYLNSQPHLHFTT